MTERTESQFLRTKIEHWLLVWLQGRLGQPVDRSTPLFNETLDSLGILEMTAACQEECALSFALDQLQLADLETVESFAAAVAKVANPEERRIWHEFQVPALGMKQLLKLRSQLPEGLLLRTADRTDMIKIGVLENSSLKKSQLQSLVEQCLMT
jgi:hypothetical protein